MKSELFNAPVQQIFWRLYSIGLTVSYVSTHVIRFRQHYHRHHHQVNQQVGFEGILLTTAGMLLTEWVCTNTWVQQFCLACKTYGPVFCVVDGILSSQLGPELRESAGIMPGMMPPMMLLNFQDQIELLSWSVSWNVFVFKNPSFCR